MAFFAAEPSFRFADGQAILTPNSGELGLALDENSKRNRSREKRGLATYIDQLEPLRDKRIVFIFDECHRSQFGDNHQAIKEFFPKAQLFGFTGTPIFEENATYKRIEGDVQTLKTTQDLFQQSLHEYTITHAIEDRNVLRFHIDYYKPDGKNPPRQGEALAKRAIIDAILAKHDAATGGRKFNAILATASINDAIEYHGLFEQAQAEKQQADPAFAPLNIAAVFSPPNTRIEVRAERVGTGLAAEVEDLKSGEEAVEERARSELGMIKPGEKFYRVVEPATGGAPAPVDEEGADETAGPGR
jgi:type I restriction enzyme R subunit